MCTLLIFPCLPKMSIPVPLADLAEPPTTDKERQALETLQCQYLGNIGKLVWDRIPRHPPMLPCLPCRPALPFPVTTSQCHGTLPALARFLRQVDDVAIAIFLHANSSVSSWTAAAAPFSCPGPKWITKNLRRILRKRSVAIKTDEASRITARIKLNPGPNLPSVSRVAPITDPEFLTHFNSKFPLPQNLSWRLAHPTPAMLSNVISTLRGQRLPMQQWMTKPESTVGTPGCNTWPNGDKPRTCPTCPNTTSRKSSWPSAPGFALDSSGKSGKLEPNLSKKPCVTWHRPLYWLDLPTPDAPPAHGNSIFPSLA